MARAMWKGALQLGKRRVNVKMYAAVEDRTVHFRLLHAKDRAPVEQHIVRKDTGKEVAKDDVRKAFAVNRSDAVILQPEDLAELEPQQSREIEVSQFVAPEALGDQWYERPYYLGPDGATADYFALAQALERKKVVGVARWVMRKKRYVGALTAYDGYLTLTTLRYADQVLQFSGVEPMKTAAPGPTEIRLAEQLVASIEADFDPAAWKNEYDERLCKLIEAKARGEKIKVEAPKRKKAPTDLAESLKASLAAVKERKVA